MIANKIVWMREMYRQYNTDIEVRIGDKIEKYTDSIVSNLALPRSRYVTLCAFLWRREARRKKTKTSN